LVKFNIMRKRGFCNDTFRLEKLFCSDRGYVISKKAWVELMLKLLKMLPQSNSNPFSINT